MGDRRRTRRRVVQGGADASRPRHVARVVQLAALRRHASVGARCRRPDDRAQRRRAWRAPTCSSRRASLPTARTCTDGSRARSERLHQDEARVLRAPDVGALLEGQEPDGLVERRGCARTRPSLPTVRTSSPGAASRRRPAASATTRSRIRRPMPRRWKSRRTASRSISAATGVCRRTRHTPTTSPSTIAAVLGRCACRLDVVAVRLLDPEPLRQPAQEPLTASGHCPPVSMQRPSHYRCAVSRRSTAGRR